jgi:hypothetical protein
LAFISNFTQLAAAGDDGVVRIWDLPRPHSLNGEAPTEKVASPPALEFKVGGAPTVSLAALPGDSRQLVIGGNDGLVRIWDVDNGQEAHRFRHGDSLATLAVSPDGQRVSTIGGGVAKLWDVADGQMLTELQDDYRHQLLVADARRKSEVRKQQQKGAANDLEAAKKRKDDEDKNAAASRDELKKAQEAVTQKQTEADKILEAKQRAEQAVADARAQVTSVEQKLV